MSNRVNNGPRRPAGIAARWRMSSNPARHRALSVESLEERSLLSASPNCEPDTPEVPSPEATTLAVQAVPAASPSDDFVTALYSDILGRAPDAGGLAFFTNLLNSGASPAAIVDDIWQSQEHRGNQVDFFYQTFLGRTADFLGRQFWVDKMLDGMSEEDVMTSFTVTGEYQQLNPLSTPFVTALYLDMLGRAPDPAGLSVWVSALEGDIATPLEVSQSILDSQERHTNLVTFFYTNYLLRAPDAPGLATWVVALDQNQVDDQYVAEFFLSSAEYINLHPIV